ncbi:alpha/beta fold hydrolase [Paenirhodobacter enshiensis]|uniref:Alpha/beta hydrolase n=1 Tax=Paenirhodobacter enshiensis TaxID=1105367 RepID=A0A086XR32_9RHOB|nr:alpha/beta hydrolase [Paenirhodobacter enshiensis]KFI24482.1 alpha/beta hydrolase [Paenirhodobacter enshiensis]
MPGDPLVFLPGFMCDMRLFWHQLMHFSAERPVIVLPLAGETIEEMADNVTASLPERFTLVGHWLGGIVAMEILRRVPHRVTEAVLMDVSAMGESAQFASQREDRIIMALSDRLDEAMLEEIPASTLGPGEAALPAQALLLEMAASLGPEAFARQSRALMRRPDLQRALRSARQRVLLLCGEFDTICPPRRHEILAELMLLAEFRMVRGAGHLLPLEAPEEITRIMDKWFAVGRKALEG